MAHPRSAATELLAGPRGAWAADTRSLILLCGSEKPGLPGCGGV